MATGLSQTEIFLVALCEDKETSKMYKNEGYSVKDCFKTLQLMRRFMLCLWILFSRTD